MKRRELIAHLVVAAAISIRPAYAEKGVRPVVGYLGFDSADKSTELLVAFREGLSTAGFVENQNVAIQYRFAEGKYDRFPELIANLIQSHVQVIVAATGTNGVLAKNIASPFASIASLSGSQRAPRNGSSAMAAARAS